MWRRIAPSAGADSADSQYTYAEHIFQDDTVNEINIEIDEADWQDMLENPLEEEYHKANITINGETVGNVAIRTRQQQPDLRGKL